MFHNGKLCFDSKKTASDSEVQKDIIWLKVRPKRVGPKNRKQIIVFLKFSSDFILKKIMWAPKGHQRVSISTSDHKRLTESNSVELSCIMIAICGKTEIGELLNSA